MNRFIIGQYGSFDYKKYNRDFREGFYGIEACLFRHEQDLANLVQEATQVGFQIGVHFPLRAGISRIRDALFLSSDRAVRLQAYDLIQQELDYFGLIGAVGVLKIEVSMSMNRHVPSRTSRKPVNAYLRGFPKKGESTILPLS
ncbi:hypothetical protein [Gorillibacterium sp. CAU 1737]|uniref:hypothetical protein n=1 Tax=Gorillibacterium sp. CAU 1737 TaxID=3140362 RepID=UPI003260A58C